MTTHNLNIRALAEELAAAHPDLNLGQQRLALAGYRLLGEGQPFGVHDLAEHTGRPPEEAAAFLEQWPLVQRDRQGRVLGFGGLSLKPTSHALELDGRTLYAWCALDTLFLPERLGRPARVRSTDPETRETISLTVNASGPDDVAPEGAVMTLHRVSGFDAKNVVGTFCCYVHFFGSDESARAGAKRSEGSYVVSIAQGFEYGRIYNHRQLGAALKEAAT
jgi:alkylmercury lyase